MGTPFVQLAALLHELIPGETNEVLGLAADTIMLFVGMRLRLLASRSKNAESEGNEEKHENERQTLISFDARLCALSIAFVPRFAVATGKPTESDQTQSEQHI